LAVIVIVVGAWLGDLRLNLTPSEPLGLWRIVPLDRPAVAGDLVFICPPAGAVSAFGLERGYFRRGLCAGGTAPLIKTVAATAGSRVLVDADVVIDGVLLPRSRLSPTDVEGRSLSPWPGGVVQPGQIFLHSSFAGSYDSRYFGPVPAAGLLGLARPVLVFDP
jgi:conjugative transfer signal peptidase TraF